jgi:hypothetical protein
MIGVLVSDGFLMFFSSWRAQEAGSSHQLQWQHEVTTAACALNRQDTHTAARGQVLCSSNM